MGLLIENGIIIFPDENRAERKDLWIEEGIIKAFLNVEEASVLKRNTRIQSIDAAGILVSPGLIDMHVHFREPGEEYKETIKTGSHAAVTGGFTAVACMPNTKPPNDSASVTRFILEKATIDAFCSVHPIACISIRSEGKQLSEFAELKAAGAVAFSDDGKPVMNSDLMRRALEYARLFGAPIITHAEDIALSEGGVMNEGPISTMLGLPGIPYVAEDIMTYRDVALAQLTCGRLHVAHVSTKGAVEIIRQAKARGAQVTAETAPHYFTLTDKAVESVGTDAKVNPPLRTEEDVEAIRIGLKDGTIDAIASDHAPHSILEKDTEFDRAAFGIVGLETSVGLSLELVRKGFLTLPQVILKLSTNPARILGISGGYLKVGESADLTLINPEEEYAVNKDQFKSQGKNTPFQGWNLKGRAVTTIVAGQVVWDLTQETAGTIKSRYS